MPMSPWKFIPSVLIRGSSVSSIINELGTEDATFNFNDVITSVTYADNFATNVFSRNDGSTAWVADWDDIDDFDGNSGGDSGDGPLAGNIQVSGGKLSLTSNPNTAASGRAPSISRAANFSNFDVTEPVLLNFQYTYSDLNASDSIIVEASDDFGSTWEAFPAYTGLTGTNLGSPVSQSLNINNLNGNIDATDLNNNGVTILSLIHI